MHKKYKKNPTVRWLMLWVAWLLSHIGSLEAKELTIVSSQPIVGAWVDALRNPDQSKHSTLLGRAMSAHHYAMTPQDRSLLLDAHMIVMMHPHYEFFLTESLERMKDSFGSSPEGVMPTVLALEEAREVTLSKPWRSSLLKESELKTDYHCEHPENNHHDHKVCHADQELDLHGWMSPSYAKAMVGFLARKMGERDLARSDFYEKRAKAYQALIQTMDQTLEKHLSFYRHVPILALHDGIGYAARYYQLLYLGGLSLHEEAQLTPSIKQAIQKLHQRYPDLCIIIEPDTSETMRKALQTMASSVVRYSVDRPMLFGLTVPTQERLMVTPKVLWPEGLPRDAYMETMFGFLKALHQCVPHAR